MSNHGVDLLRSDTGHLMQWPVARAPSATLAAPGSWTQPVDAELFTPSAPSAPSAPAARAVVVSTAPDRGTLAVTLLNWMILLALFCTFLLAVTAGSPAAGG